MSWTPLKENYTDAVWSGLRKYNLIENSDDTISLQDVTVYSQKENSFYGALDANRTNAAINIIMAMLENGTDLYTNFQQYFATQEALFEQTADGKQSDFTAYLNAIKADADETEENFEAYITALEAQGDNIIASIKTDYSAEIQRFEDVQEQVFTVWFESIRGQMSGDIATNIINRINAIVEQEFNRYYGLCNKTTGITKNSQGNTEITEIDLSELVLAVTVISTLLNGNKQIVTTVTPEESSYKYVKTTVIAKVDSVIPYYERTITEADPAGTENPAEEGWYVLDDGDYVPTEDTEVESGTTYYILTYTQVEVEEGDNPVSEGWYVRFGSQYTLATETSVSSGTRISESYTKEAK